MTPENRELLSRLKAGDNAARRELYDRHHAKLRRYFLNWLSHRAEAEDCANEVFTLAWEGLAAGLEPRESIEQWLWGIARNVRSQRYQARGRELVGGDEVVAARLGDTGDDFDGFDDIDKDGKREAVRDAWEIIQALTPTGRAVLTLHLEATHRRGYEIKGAELSAELGERTWPRARVDRELNRAKDSVKLGMGVLAVARAASACPLAASIVARPIRTCASPTCRGPRAPPSPSTPTPPSRRAGDAGSCSAMRNAPGCMRSDPGSCSSPRTRPPTTARSGVVP